jgi:hypothetical protein
VHYVMYRHDALCAASAIRHLPSAICPDTYLMSMDPDPVRTRTRFAPSPTLPST